MLFFFVVVITGCNSCEKELTLDYGFTVTTESFDVNTIVSIPEPKWDKHVFKGWAKSKDGTPETKNLLVTMDKDYTYYAIWNNLYTVTFYLWKLESGAERWTTYDYESGSQLNLNNWDLNETFNIKDNEMPPYLFIGWSFDNTPTNLVEKFVLECDTTVYGVWEQNIFHITFDLNGGTGTTPAEIKIKKGDYINYTSLPTSGFSYGVYTFEGWSETKNGKVITSDFKPAKDMTLYAVWSHNGQVKDKTDDN